MSVSSLRYSAHKSSSVRLTIHALVEGLVVILVVIAMGALLLEGLDRQAQVEDLQRAAFQASLVSE